MHRIARRPHNALFLLAGMAAMGIWQAERPIPARIETAQAHAAIVAPDRTAPSDPAGMRATRAADGLFYVRASVNGHPIRFLVDTGASVVVLAPADAAAVGLAPHPDSFDSHVETAAGKAPMAWATIDEISIAGRQVRGVRAAVMRDGLGVSLLGQNMLARLGSVRMEGDQLELR